MTRLGYDGTLVTARGSGVSRCILELAHALASSRACEEILIYVTRPGLWPGPVGPARRLVVTPAPTRWRAGRILWQQGLLPRRTALDELDLFHAAGYVMPLAIRVPTVLTIFDLIALDHPALTPQWTRIHYGRMLPRSIRRAARIITPSRRVRDGILERFEIPEERVVVVPPGINERFRQSLSPAALEQVRARFGLPDRFTLFVGGLEPKKNASLALAAFERARARGLDGGLVLVGAPRRGSAPRAIARAPHVHWLGHVTDPEMQALYQLADEVLLPSLVEGFGLPAIEAMASGTPVITSDTPAVAESDPTAVVRIDPRSVDDVSGALLRLRQDTDLRRTLRERGLAASAPFSWDRAARRTADVYREALAS